MEEYRAIKGYEGMYEVSNLGNVRSLDREIYQYKSGVAIRKGKQLKASDNGRGYLRVGLTDKGKEVKRYIHQLVAESFLNHLPDKHSRVVDHIDNNPLNNTLTNLQILTTRENCTKNRTNRYSKYTGVSKRYNKWLARITINDKTVLLGSFDTELEAHNTYQSKIKELC